MKVDEGTLRETATYLEDVSAAYERASKAYRAALQRSMDAKVDDKSGLNACMSSCVANKIDGKLVAPPLKSQPRHGCTLALANKRCCMRHSTAAMHSKAALSNPVLCMLSS